MGLGNDRTGVAILDSGECDGLLRRGGVGRVGFTVDGEIDILPVTYVYDDYCVAFRTAPGEKLSAAVMGRAVAFEIDYWDDATRSGWSVLVKGTAESVSDADQIDRLDATGLAPYANPEVRDRWVVIRPLEITGRAVEPPPDTP